MSARTWLVTSHYGGRRRDSEESTVPRSIQKRKGTPLISVATCVSETPENHAPHACYVDVVRVEVRVRRVHHPVQEDRSQRSFSVHSKAACNFLSTSSLQESIGKYSSRIDCFKAASEYLVTHIHQLVSRRCAFAGCQIYGLPVRCENILLCIKRCTHDHSNIGTPETLAP